MDAEGRKRIVMQMAPDGSPSITVTHNCLSKTLNRHAEHFVYFDEPDCIVSKAQQRGCFPKSTLPFAS
jgi:hypothetical protein